VECKLFRFAPLKKPDVAGEALVFRSFFKGAKRNSCGLNVRQMVGAASRGILLVKNGCKSIAFCFPAPGLNAGRSCGEFSKENDLR